MIPQGLPALGGALSGTFTRASGGAGTAAIGVATVAAGTVLVSGTGTSALGLGTVGQGVLAQYEVLTPDGTDANSGWSVVGAATVHAALAVSDADYILATAAGNTTTVTLSNPVQDITPESVRIVIRARS